MEKSRNKQYRFANNMRKQALSYTGTIFKDSSKIDFTNISLTHSRFHHCVFENISFKRAAVTGSIFECCKFINCNLNDADMEFCEFRQCEITIPVVHGCSFNNSNFIDTHIKDTCFEGCTFTGAFIESSNINNVKLEYSTTEGACFTNCTFKNLDWRELNLEYSEFVNPNMDNVVLPFFQIPYIFGLLSYLSRTSDNVRISNDKTDISLDEYFSQGIPFLMNDYLASKQLFPLCNIYLYGRTADYNKAFEYLALHVSELSMIRDFRGIKFCCKLISMCPIFKKKHLNKIYKIIINTDISINQNSAEMKSFARNIGEIRSILFSRKKEPCLTIKLGTNIGIEYSLRFSNLINQFHTIAKPNHTDRIQTSITLSYNSPLIIEINITGDVTLFATILYSFLILTGVPLEKCPQFPLIRSLKHQSGDNFFDASSNSVLISSCREKLVCDGIQLEILEYYTRDCDEFLLLDDKRHYFDSKMLALR